MRPFVLKLFAAVFAMLLIASPVASRPHNPIGRVQEYGTPKSLSAVVKARFKAERARYKRIAKLRRKEQKRIQKLRRKKKKEAAKRAKKLAKLRKKHAREVAKRRKIQQKKELARIKAEQAKSGRKSVNGDDNTGESDAGHLDTGVAKHKKSKTFWGRFWSTIISR